MTPARSLEQIPLGFWRMVALARHRLLMLDYDGTLAPFRVARAEALPLPRIADLLRKLAAETHTTLAIVSGRPLVELTRLLGTPAATLIGDHGWELRKPAGEVVRHPLPARAAESLAEGARQAHQRGWEQIIERKRCSLVLHTRGLPAAHAAELQAEALALWGSKAASGVVSAERTDGGVELRATGRNKGTAVLSLLSRSAPGTLPVFVGDDLTDEDAFAALQNCGFGVRVDRDDRPSLAYGRLPSCEAVGDFLDEWLRVAGQAARDGTPAQGG